MADLEKMDVLLGVGRRELLSRLSKYGERAIDVLGAACDKGDTNAAKIILGKMLPDLKAVDVTQLESSQARIVINPRIYIRAEAGKKQVKLPNININIQESKEQKVIQEVDISPQLKASLPVAEVEQKNFRTERKSGVFK